MQTDYTADKIPGWLSKNEEKLLAHFAKKSTGVIVEIGSFQGKSTVAMAKSTKNPIYAIDPHLGQTHSVGKKLPPTYQSFLKNTKQYKNIIPVRKTSEEANKNWSLPIALLHIDALHEYEFVKQDLKMWLPFLKDGGVVICHDAFGPEPDVFKAINEEILDKQGWGYVGVLDSQFFAIKGKPQLNWQRPFIILASNIWHNKNLPENIRFFVVNRVLKIFFLNKFMFWGIFGRL